MKNFSNVNKKTSARIVLDANDALDILATLEKLNFPSETKEKLESVLDTRNLKDDEIGLNWSRWCNLKYKLLRVTELENWKEENEKTEPKM